MSTRPLRVAILVVDDRFDNVSAKPFFGPAPTALLEGLTSLGAAKVEAHIVSCVKVKMPAPDQLADNVFYHQIVLPHWTYLRSLHAGPILGVRSILSRLRPDIVHSHGVERWCAVAGALSGFPAVLTIHGHLRLILQKSRMRPFFYWHLQMILGEWAIRRHRGVICISSHIQNSLQGSAAKTWLIPNAIRNEFIHASALPAQTSNSVPRILIIGTITENKRPLELLNIFSDLHANGAKFSVCFIGHLDTQDKYGAAFNSEIQKARSQGFAEHFGYADSHAIIALMAQADALVHFPREEAFGLVVAEALSQGMKVFASGVGGIVDICRTMPGAVLIPPNDYIHLYRQLQQWIAAGHAKAPEAAVMARDRYRPSTIAMRTLRAYYDVLGVAQLPLNSR